MHRLCVTILASLCLAAVLSGPDGALDWIEHGGAIVYDDRTIELVEPAPLRVDRLARL